MIENPFYEKTAIIGGIQMAEQPKKPHKNKKQVRTFRSVLRRETKRILNKINAFRLPINDNLFQTIIKLTVTVAAVAAVAFVCISDADISPSGTVRGFKDKRVLSHASGQGYPAEINGSRSIDAETVSHGTAVLTDTAYTVYDVKGRELISQTHYMASPAMKTADRYTLLFDRMGTAYTLKTLSGSVCSGETDHAIVAGAVSRSGRFAFVTNYDTAHSYVHVFSKNGKSLHKWKSGSYHISDISVSPSGHTVAMCGVTTENGKLKSAIIIQKVGGNANLREYTFDDTLLVAVQFTGDGSVTAIGDDKAVRLRVNEEKTQVYSYAGRTLTAYDISDNGQLALAFSPHSDGQNTSVAVINAACEEIANVATDLTSPYMELTNSRINLISQSRFYSYNFSGKLMASADIPADSQSVLTSGGKVLIRGITTVSEAS